MQKRGGYSCAMKDCKNISGRIPGLSFFSFPHDPKRAQIWLTKCGRSLEAPTDNWQKNYRVCANHFKNSMFLNDLRNRLQPHATPISSTEDDGNNLTFNSDARILYSSDKHSSDIMEQPVKRLKVENLSLTCYEDELSEAQLAKQNTIKEEYEMFIKYFKQLESLPTCVSVKREVYTTIHEFVSQQKAEPPPLTLLERSLSGNLPVSTTPVIQVKPISEVQKAAAEKLPSPPAMEGVEIRPKNIAELAEPSTSARSTPPSVSTESRPKPKPGPKPSSTPALSSKKPSPPPTKLKTGLVITQPQKPTLTKAVNSKGEVEKFKVSSKALPSEEISIGGLLVGKPLEETYTSQMARTVLTREDKHALECDIKLVSIPARREKTYPSLIVFPKALIQPRAYPTAMVNTQRADLDSQVKKIVTMTPAHFTEFLLREGLVRSEHTCPVHKKSLKLGMYVDAGQFSHSGGFVWVSECCPTRFVSVYQGSIFERSHIHPTILLKLIYHWACQTNVVNIASWVKVDPAVIRCVYTDLRSVCTAALHERFAPVGSNSQMMGGVKKKIQVGIVSLGTSTSDGSSREIKVEILGVLDFETQQMRLRACEPYKQSSGNKGNKFSILNPLKEWVYKSSIILTDHTVDKSALLSLGFAQVRQNELQRNKPLNQDIMDYLKKVVPRMLQSTLPVLSVQIIQQFLDELVWRELYGPTAFLAFNSILKHISEQTLFDKGKDYGLLNRLVKIASNPFKDWAYANWDTNCMQSYSKNKSTPDKVVEVVNLDDSDEENNPHLLSSPTSHSDLEPIPSTSSGISKQMPPTTHHFTEPIVSVIEEEPAAESQLQDFHRVPLPTIENLPFTIKNSAEPSHSTSQMVRPAEIALEPYFYATVPVSKDLAARHIFLNEIRSKCVMCNNVFSSNLTLAKHLVLHALNGPVLTMDKDSRQLCHMCVRIIPRHLYPSHSQEHSNDVPSCKICGYSSNVKHSLANHMLKNHFEMEMPFHCDRCSLRTSVFAEFIGHYTLYHQNSTFGYCPFCLLTVNFTDKYGKPIYKLQFFFLSHVKKHLLSQNVQCNSCPLWFTNKTIWMDHNKTYHRTGKNIGGATRWNKSNNLTIIPAPLRDPVPKGISRHPGYSNIAKYTTIRMFSKGLNYDFSSGMRCYECFGRLNLAHFLLVMRCAFCPYVTACVPSMTEHSEVYHLPPDRKIDIHQGVPVKFKSLLVCKMCSFSTYDGNNMAKHAVECGSTVLVQSVKDLVLWFYDDPPSDNVVHVKSEPESSDEEDLLARLAQIGSTRKKKKFKR